MREMLSPAELEQRAHDVKVRAQMVFRYVTPVVIAVPQDPDAPINTGTAWKVRLPRGIAVVTADHVLRCFERRRAEDERVRLQIDELPLDLAGRETFRNASDDLAMIHISDVEASKIRSLDHIPKEWPPRIPPTDSRIIVVGAPRMTRTRSAADELNFGPLIAELPVKGDFANHLTCRIEREHIRVLDDKALPSPADYGGMSGGPVFLDAGIDFPIVGFVKEAHEELDYFVIQGLAAAATFLK